MKFWQRRYITFARLGKYGRLGNQLFQIAAVVGLVRRHGGRFRLPRWEYAEDFHLDGCFDDQIRFRKQYDEPQFDYAPIPYSRSLNLQGYFQSEKFFAHCKDEIKQLFSFRNPPTRQEGYVSIHVRRGDYVNNAFYTALPCAYYMKALEKLNGQRVLVFSDDIAWCKREFTGNEFEFSEGERDVDDLAIMAACDDHVIANSSFSWWAAYLGRNDQRRVVAPNLWFGEAYPDDPTAPDLIPVEWMRESW